MKEAPLQPFNPPYRLSRMAMLGQPTDHVGMPLADHLKQKAFINTLFDQFAAADPGVKVLDPTPQLCDTSGFCRAEKNGNSLYADDNHLSEVGAELIIPVLQPLFESLPAKGSSGLDNANTAR